MRPKGIASVVFALAAAVTAVAQTPSARDDAMPFLRDISRVALRNVRIIDGTGAPARQNQTLIIDNGRIRALGGVTEIVIPEGTQTLDLDGRTVLPGFVMLHEHMFYASENDNTHPQPFTSPRLFLAFGLTTIRTAGTDHPYVDLNLKRGVDAGQVPGPEMHLTSPAMNGAVMNGFLGDKVVRNPEDARGFVRYWAAEGFTSFKAYQLLSREALAAAIDEAHRLGLRVTAHLGSSVTCRDAVEVGIDNLEHAFGPCTRLTRDDLGTDPDGPRAQDFIRILIARKVVLTFTPGHEISHYPTIKWSCCIQSGEIDTSGSNVRRGTRLGLRLPRNLPGC